jgi:MFS family permease
MTAPPAPPTTDATVAALPVPNPQPQVDLRQALGIITLAWAFGAMWMFTINGAAMNRFGKAIGMTDAAFGFLAALPFVGTAMQLPAIYYIARLGHRRSVFLWFGVINRLLWIVAAIVPWLLPDGSPWRWRTVLVILAVSWMMNHVSTPAWYSWMSDLIPRRIRGRYFGNRVRLGQVAGLITTLLAGMVLDKAAAYGAAAGEPEYGQSMLVVSSVLLALAGVLGVIDIVCFVRVPDVHDVPADRTLSWGRFLSVPLADRDFRTLMVFSFTLTMATGFMGHYTMLYMFDVIGVSSSRVNVLLVLVPLMCQAIMVKFWGGAIDRMGCKPVLVVCLLLTTGGGFGWLLIQPGHLWFGYIIALSASLAWSGVDLANMTLGMRMAGRDEKSGLVTGHQALNSFALAMGGMCSGLMAAGVARNLHDWSTVLSWPALGLSHDGWAGADLALTYHGLLFFGSGVLRLVALGVILKFHEPKAAETRDAIRYVTDGIWSTMKMSVVVPTRFASVAGQTFVRHARLRVARHPRRPSSKTNDRT